MFRYDNRRLLGNTKIFEGKIKMDFDQSWSCVMINDQKENTIKKHTKCI